MAFPARCPDPWKHLGNAVGLRSLPHLGKSPHVAPFFDFFLFFISDGGRADEWHPSLQTGFPASKRDRTQHSVSRPYHKPQRTLRATGANPELTVCHVVLQLRRGAIAEEQRIGGDGSLHAAAVRCKVGTERRGKEVRAGRRRRHVRH